MITHLKYMVQFFRVQKLFIIYFIRITLDALVIDFCKAKNKKKNKI